MYFRNEPWNKKIPSFLSLYVFDVKPLIKCNMKRDNMNFMQKYFVSTST